MWQRLIEYIKRFWNRLTGQKESVVPSAPPKVETPQTAIGEPEFELVSGEPPRYQQRESLFTYRERVFFQALLEDISGQYVVFAKVRLGDVLFLANEPGNRKYHNNQIQCKHLDFVLCARGTYKPLLAIELDDSSHDKYDHRERDEFKDKICADAGLKLWRERIKPMYPKGFIGERVRGKIEGREDREDRAGEEVQ
ncbi:MAG: DUF2726 domain-containing protein [Chloroflexi bacterium]|nr:DUF2726 domain-containing protein [Chloroflexota bacterium]